MKTRISVSIIALVLVIGLILPGYGKTTKTKDIEIIAGLGDLGGEVWGLDVSSGPCLKIMGISNDYLVLYPRESQPAGKYSPGLAERWETSPDHLTWDFYLREGIQFHDGWGELTAEDVKFSWEQAGRDGSVHTNAGMFRKGDGGQTESVTVIDPYHIRIKLTAPKVMFLFYVSDGEGQLPIISKKYFETVGHDKAIKHPIGTGPWRFIEHKTAQYIKYEAQENHWEKTPEFKYLTLKVIPEESTRIAMLKTGEIQITDVSMERVAELERAGFRIKRIPGAIDAYITLGGNFIPEREHYDPTCPWVPHQDEPSDSEWNQRALKVRQAMFFAINRQAIIDNIFMGEAIITPVCAFPASGIYVRPEWKPYPYDLEKAKRLLAEAGYADGFKVTVDMYSQPGHESVKDMVEAICMDWEILGLKVNRNIAEWPILRGIWGGRKSTGRVTHYGAPTYPEPWPFHRYTKHTQGWNFGVESLELDKLLDGCSTTVNDDERLEWILKLGDWCYNGYFDYNICRTNFLIAVSPIIKEWDHCQRVEVFAWYEYISLAD